LVRKKCVLVIVDGLGDVPIPALRGRTPLDAAATPVMDRLAAAGKIGLVYPIAKGVTPGTHSGTGLLMGLPPAQLGLLSRGPIEAAGLGFVLNPGDIALRANFATLEAHENGYRIVDRRADRILNGTEDLAAQLKNIDLGDGIKGNLLSTDQHRAALILSGKGLDARISDTDPKDRGMPSDVIPCTHLHESAALTAAKLNRFMEEAYRRLADHPVNLKRLQRGKLPANGVLTRSAGTQHALDNIITRLGLTAAVVSGCNTVRGLGRTFGFEVKEDVRFTADAETDLEAKMSTALALLEKHDLVFVHIKATDICSHDRQPSFKRDLLERLDEAMTPLVQDGIVIAVGADHTTNSISGSHTADPVPALIATSSRKSPGRAVKFGEDACSGGELKALTNHGFLSMVLDEMGVEASEGKFTA
jgi:2,3-bisphosphoglycerate-independent phosphoglycerate mutase